MAQETPAIDERNIAIKCTSLDALAAEYRSRLSSIDHTCETLRSIQRGPDGVNPTDSRTGAPMTDATRLEIYNAAVATATELLGLTEEEESDDG